MPSLYALQEINDGPGFLIPLFRSRSGANSDLVQTVSPTGRIEAFSSFISEGPTITAEAQDRDVGESAVWAFRSPTQEIWIGTPSELRLPVGALLNAGGLTSFPLVALDACLLIYDIENDFEIIAAIVSKLKFQDGQTDLLIDTSVFNIAIRRFIAFDPSKRHSFRPFVFTNGKHSNVYMPEEYSGSFGAFERFRTIANAFGVPNCKLVLIKGGQLTKPPPAMDWLAVGMGKFAVDAYRAAPFLGDEFAISGTRHGVVARGAVAEEFAPTLLGVENFKQMTISLEEGDKVQAASNVIKSNIGTGKYVFHYIVICKCQLARPFSLVEKGYDVEYYTANTTRMRRVGRKNLFDIGINTHDIKWVIPVSGSDVLLPGRKAALRASDFIGQISRAIFAAGGSFFDSVIHSVRVTRGRKKGQCYGIWGIARSEARRRIDDQIVAVLFSMINSLFDLKEARRIIVFTKLPFEKGEQIRRVRFLGHNHNVELRTMAEDVNSAISIGFAVGFDLRPEMSYRLSQYCKDIMNPYGWNQTKSKEGLLTFSNGKKEINFWIYEKKNPVSEFLYIEEKYQKFEKSTSPECNIILTNRPVTADDAAKALESGWTVINHNDLPRHLEDVHKSGFPDAVSARSTQPHAD